MLSSAMSRAIALILCILVAGVSARPDFVESLPKCWKECLGDTSDGCDSTECICDASQSDNYLPPAVSCAATSCDASYWELQGKLLLRLGGYCLVEGNPIPIDVASSANEAAHASATPTPTSKFGGGYGTTREVEQPQPTTNGGDKKTEVFSTTMTSTTTDDNGHTLQLVIPVFIQPETTKFGKTVTVTLDATSSDVESSTPTTESARQTASIPSLETSQAQPQAGSSTTSANGAENTSNGNNGSPFDNMQAGASRWGISGALAGLGVAVGVFMGL